jgi:hypothetical protein
VIEPVDPIAVNISKLTIYNIEWCGNQKVICHYQRSITSITSIVDDTKFAIFGLMHRTQFGDYECSRDLNLPLMPRYFVILNMTWQIGTIGLLADYKPLTSSIMWPN